MEDKQKNIKDQRKILSMLSHCSILFSSSFFSILIPVAIILLSEDEVTIGNAKEALNFCITIYILGICFGLLIFLVIGFPLLILLFVATWVMPIIAISKIAKNPNHIYRYPMIIHLL